MLSSCMALAQINKDVVHDGYGNETYVEYKIKKEEIEGTPFLLSDWAMGSLKNKDGYITNNILVKYDLIKDKIVLLQSKGENKIIELYPKYYPEFTLHYVNKETEEYKIHKFKNNYNIDNISNESYFEVVYEGKNISLLKRRLKKLETSTNLSYGEVSANKKEYKTYFKLYLFSNKTNKWEALKSSRKKIKSFLKSHSNKVEDYIDKNKLRYKIENDLIKILSYIDKD